MSDLLGLAGLVGSFYRDGLDGVTGACLPSGLAVRRKPGVFRQGTVSTNVMQSGVSEARPTLGS